MMNVERDVTIGPILRHLADNAGVVYSWAAGDEPAAILELYRFANALGFEIVAAGKGKNNPLCHDATPDTEREKAAARKMSPRMLCEFVDGSKTAVEMAAVSNATGLVPDLRGVRSARSTVSQLTRASRQPEGRRRGRCRGRAWSTSPSGSTRASSSSSPRTTLASARPGPARYGEGPSTRCTDPSTSLDPRCR